MMKNWIVCEQLVKIYKQGDLEVIALQGLDLTVGKGEMLALIGASGSGKSTLLSILGGILAPSAGRVRVGERDLLVMDEGQRTAYRQKEMGFVWQNPSQNLLSYLSVRENILWPMRGKDKAERVARLLGLVGLEEMGGGMPADLSGGQQQRAALAVALANDPALLLADELTGQLDKEGALDLLGVLGDIRDVLGTTIVMVTHDPLMAEQMDRVVTIRDGRTSSEWRPQAGEKVDEWVLVDGAGRLQMPKSYMKALGIEKRVKVEAEGERLVVSPARAEVVLMEEAERVIDWAEVLGERVGVAEGMAVRLKNVSRLFGDEASGGRVAALAEVTLSIERGRLVVISGRSGSGKSSLLNLVGGLDLPTAGEVEVLGENIGVWSEGKRALWRREKVHYMFQNFGLMPFLTAIENVELTLRLLGVGRWARGRQAAGLVEAVGLGGRGRHRAETLSGGEKQRVALARALAGRPEILLADEPTGQLDTLTGGGIVGLLRRVVDELGMTVIVASHDPQVIEAGDVVVGLVDGRVVEERVGGWRVGGDL